MLNKMESPGTWLEKSLNELSQRLESGLGLDEEVISGLVTYCELAPPQDAKEYLDNIVGAEVGKNVIDEYLRRRGFINPSGSSNPQVPTSKLQTYVKPPLSEWSSSGTKKPFKAPRDATIANKNFGSHVPTDAISESKNTNKSNQGGSKKKKTGKVINLAEAAKGSIVFQQGKPCSCQARRHKLVSNCLSCGKIVCEQEGEGPCSFCGALVLREGSTYAGLDESLPILSDSDVAAEAYAKRLVDYDRNSAARTTVIDDQSDYYAIEENSWLSVEEKELLMKKREEIFFAEKKREEIEEAEKAQRNKVVISFDLVGRKVTVNKDDVSEAEAETGILRPPDEREINRIKPNPTVKVQPEFVDPGPSTKATTKLKGKSIRPASGVCLEITGRVQHSTDDFKGLTIEDDPSTADIWPGSSSNGASYMDDDIECR